MLRWIGLKNIYTGKKLKEVATMRVKNTDVYKMQFLYDRMHDWFIENGWGGETGTDNASFGETLFRLQEFQNGTKNWRIHWRLVKTLSDYIKFYWDVDFNIIKVQEVEIMHNDQKIKTQKADCDINMQVRMEYDVGGSWANHWLLRYFVVIFPKRIYRRELEEAKERAYREAYQLQHTVKEFWKFRRWAEEPEFGTVDRPKGLPDYEK